MLNHKKLLADFYFNLLMLKPTDRFRLTNQPLYAHIRDILADELDSTPEVVQNIFERMVVEYK